MCLSEGAYTRRTDPSLGSNRGGANAWRQRLPIRTVVFVAVAVAVFLVFVVLLLALRVGS